MTQLDKLGIVMLNRMREHGKKHLLSNNAHKWQSAYLDDEDIIQIETATGKKVRCSCESGEYFYKLE